MYMSSSVATTELLWLQSLLTESGFSLSVPAVFCDSLSTIALAHNPVLHARTKHMELDMFFLRETMLQKQLQVSHVPGTQQCAKIMTKKLPSSKFENFRTELTVCDSSKFTPS